MDSSRPSMATPSFAATTVRSACRAALPWLNIDGKRALSALVCSSLHQHAEEEVSALSCVLLVLPRTSAWMRRTWPGETRAR